LPNMTVIVPGDVNETRKAVEAAAKIKGPVYIRFARTESPVVTTNKSPFKIGRAEVLWKGKDVTLVAAGPVVYEALLAAKELESQNIKAEVIDCHTIKPIDAATLAKSARKTGCVVSVEEHQIHGGVGSAVSEALSKTVPVPQEYIGMQDQFGVSGEPIELLEKFGMTSPAIVKAVKKVMKRKS